MNEKQLLKKYCIKPIIEAGKVRFSTLLYKSLPTNDAWRKLRNDRDAYIGFGTILNFILKPDDIKRSCPKKTK